MNALSRAEIERDVRERLFGGSRAQSQRIGAEVEVIPLWREDRTPAAVQDSDSRPGTLSWLRSIAEDLGWIESLSPYCIPSFDIPGVGRLSYEPGGQIELSTTPFDTPSDLLRVIRDTLAMLHARAPDEGLLLLEAGLDPFNDVAAAPLQWTTRRYSRMAAHFARFGGDGARMMRQTAALQLSVDVAPEDVADCWRAFNALAPALIAAFANSPTYMRRDTGDSSHRARIWQNVDRTRTGVFPGADAAAEYSDFALGASAFLADESSPPLRDLVASGRVTPEIWNEHLSTLFPEIRPRGYFEVRGCDMVDDDARAALVALVWATATDARARREISALAFGLPEDAFERAPRGEADLIACADAALEIALRATRHAPPASWVGEDLGRIDDFRAKYSSRGRAPAGELFVNAPTFSQDAYAHRRKAE